MLVDNRDEESTAIPNARTSGWLENVVCERSDIHEHIHFDIVRVNAKGSQKISLSRVEAHKFIGELQAAFAHSTYLEKQ